MLTDVNFWERSSGNRTRIYSMVKYLAPLTELTVVNTGPAPLNIESILAMQFKAEFHILENTKYLSSNGYGRRLRTLLKGRQFDTIIIQYIHSSYFLNYLVNDAQIILDTHDIISDRTDEFKKFNYPGTLYEMSAEAEAELFKVYDHIMAICKPDRERICQASGNDNVLLCPHPMIPRSRTIRNKVKNIAFVGSAYLPNRDAINFFIDNCWDKIADKYDVQLSIYGSVCAVVVNGTHKGVLLKGFEPDADKIYDEADIMINPVRFGAGLKIKNVEALANGIPLVTTTHGARGLEAIQNIGFLLADDPYQFYNAIISLIERKALRQNLTRCAFNFIDANFSPEKCFLPLMEVI